MKKLIVLFLCLSLFYSCNQKKEQGSGNLPADSVNVVQAFRLWAPSPPMGWNSYNCYGAAVTESEVKANAKYMAEKLKEFGWKYIVVDFCWSYPHPPGSIQSNPPQFRLEADSAYVPWLAMDEYGRLYPDPRKFPSSQGGMGFKPLADYVHSLGLKFGIHVMRGIPRQAVWAKSKIKGTMGIDASLIADTSSTCPWLNQMYGLNMKARGAQEYYNSLAELYASWGVDYIKMDDMYQNENKVYFGEEAEAMHKAIIQNGRPIVLSLSPFMGFENKDHIKSVSNLWRISKDFWDDWESLVNQFYLADQWNEAREPGNWPDADMLQLGRISRRGPSGPERQSNFTEDEQMTHMFFWCIMKSPLMMGGDMPLNTDFVLRLLTNPEIISVNQSSVSPQQLFHDEGKVAWYSRIPGTDNLYLALFNLTDKVTNISLSLNTLGIDSQCRIRDLWNRKDLGEFSGSFSETIRPHGAMIFSLTHEN